MGSQFLSALGSAVRGVVLFVLFFVATATHDAVADGLASAAQAFTAITSITAVTEVTAGTAVTSFTSAPAMAGQTPAEHDRPELMTSQKTAIAQLERGDIARIPAEPVPLAEARYSRQDLLVGLLAVVTLALGAILLITRMTLIRERRLVATLAMREKEYRLLLDNSQDGVLQTRPDGSILRANRSACETFGLSEEELQRVDRGKVIDISDPRLAVLLRERKSTGRARGELTMIRGDGTRFEAELASSVYTSTDGTEVTSTVIRDMSERKRVEAELLLLQTCIENLNDAVLITEAEPFDEPGPRIVFVNPAFTRLTGYSRDEVLGRSPRFLQGPDTSKAELQRIGAALRCWKPVRAEILNYAKDGREFWLDLQMVPLADGNGRFTHWVAVERDVTSRKHDEEARRSLEVQVRESQKMEAIGTLAGGIAHDFNNILGAILGNAALAQNDLLPGHAAQASLEQLLVAASRARSLVKQILTFSRRDTQEMHAQPLAPLVHEAAALLRATLPASVTLDLVLDDAPLFIEADATQIQQVLLNLCTNAWQALRGSTGRIELRLQALPADLCPVLPGLRGLPGLPEIGCAHLSVSDNGAGMDEATRARIFDPFFTTKPVGQGTGLGLSVVHGIVSSHHGAISVHSQPGQGTRFDLYFPTVQAPLDAVSAPAGDDDAARFGAAARASAGQHVLYVDDDQVMLLMVERLLLQLGYRPQCVHSPELALQTFRAELCFDIVVSDYNMPGMSGIELARALLAIDPALPIVISTGFITETLREEARQLGVSQLIRKEHTLEEIGPAIRQALAERLSRMS